MVLAVLVAAAAVAVAVVLVTGGGGGSTKGGTVKGAGAKANAFTISYPASWKPVAKDKLAGLPGKPLAVIRRTDGKGYVVIRREPGHVKNLNNLGASLTKDLKKRIPDFTPRTSKVLTIKAGPALFASYIRKKTATVNSVVVVPAGKRTFSINTVSRGGANDVARDIGRMILSFNTR